MKTMAAVTALALALGMMAMTTGHAQITIPTVTVGDAGNPNDTTGYGGVSYIYNIAVTEVNLTQYTAFLNAVAATDLYSLYNAGMGTDSNSAGITRGGSSGSYTYAVKGSGARPVTYVSWFDAARFANWVANGQPTGAQQNSTTENGAYSLLGAISGVEFTKNAINPNTGTMTTWWVPNENEWYKAAYYDPSVSGPSDDYWLYPTQGDSAPGNTIGTGANQANFKDTDYSVTQSENCSSSENYLADGGAYSSSGSYYGTFDQGGNVRERTDAVTGSSGFFRGAPGAATPKPCSPTTRSGSGSTDELNFLWFRVAGANEASMVVRESSTALLTVMGGGGWFVWRRRKASL
jgi:formylglycine-generating enzyme required for sulfatase activity